MGKAIIVTTPKATKKKPGQAIVVSTDGNDTYTKSFPRAVVEFIAGDGEIGDVVECIITSQITCDITGVVGPSTLAQGKVTLTNMDEVHRCEFEVSVLCDPNPFDVKPDDKLYFSDSEQVVKTGDTVGCIPTAFGICQLVKVLESAP